jgi:hypothetical protein
MKTFITPNNDNDRFLRILKNNLKRKQISYVINQASSSSMGIDGDFVDSIGVSGSTALKGDINLVEGSNITLTQSGQYIEIASSGGGTSGYSGLSGYSGFSGYSGISGYSGVSGYSGRAGNPGESGYSGFSGYSGSGISGYSGYSGISGYSGSGISGYSGAGISGYSGYSGGGAPSDAQYVTLALNATLSAERVLTSGDGILFGDTGAGGTITVSSLNPWIAVVRTSQNDRANTATVTADEVLQFSGVAGGWYLMRGTIFFTTAATPDFKWGILTTRVVAGAYGEDEYIIPGAATTIIHTSRVTQPTDIALAGSGTTGGWIRFEYILRLSGAGTSTVSFGWSQNTSNATNTSVLTGSYIEYKKII